MPPAGRAPGKFERARARVDVGIPEQRDAPAIDAHLDLAAGNIEHASREAYPGASPYFERVAHVRFVFAGDGSRVERPVASARDVYEDSAATDGRDETGLRQLVRIDDGGRRANGATVVSDGRIVIV